LADYVTSSVSRYLKTGGIVRVEEIQDQVELSLMRQGYHKEARTYILYREERRLAREAKHKATPASDALHITLDNEQRVPL
ncbi:MAG TPA: ATP cone domain-containing protein, partial [Candidatus Berkiella sp.]|nr:ATP cone domain-containing protein [Candidatus Berkiella sp.]